MTVLNTQLDAGNKHLLRLIRKGQDADGWSSVSKILWPVVSKLPPQLVELRPHGKSGSVRLTQAGNTILDWL